MIDFRETVLVVAYTLFDGLASLIANVGLFVDWAFTEHLLISNIISAGLLLGLSDSIVQGIEHIKGNRNDEFDSLRNRRTMVVGFVLGVFNHFWYAFLDSQFKDQTLSTVLKKIACDQAIAGPFFSSAFLIGMGFMEGNSAYEIYDEWSRKFIHIYKVDWMFWPLAQFINFYVVPHRFRVFYVNIATLIWNTFLCYIKHCEHTNLSSNCKLGSQDETSECDTLVSCDNSKKVETTRSRFNPKRRKFPISSNIRRGSKEGNGQSGSQTAQPSSRNESRSGSRHRSERRHRFCSPSRSSLSSSASISWRSQGLYNGKRQRAANKVRNKKPAQEEPYFTALKNNLLRQGNLSLLKTLSSNNTEGTLNNTHEIVQDKTNVSKTEELDSERNFIDIFGQAFMNENKKPVDTNKSVGNFKDVSKREKRTNISQPSNLITLDKHFGEKFQKGLEVNTTKSKPNLQTATGNVQRRLFNKQSDLQRNKMKSRSNLVPQDKYFDTATPRTQPTTARQIPKRHSTAFRRPKRSKLGVRLTPRASQRSNPALVKVSNDKTHRLFTEMSQKYTEFEAQLSELDTTTKELKKLCIAILVKIQEGRKGLLHIAQQLGCFLNDRRIEDCRDIKSLLMEMLHRLPDNIPQPPKQDLGNMKTEASSSKAAV